LKSNSLDRPDNNQISFSKQILKKDKNEIYEKTLEWVKKENIRIIEEEKPNFIQVRHRGDWRDRTFIWKTIRFEFSNKLNGLEITVHIEKLRRAMDAYTRSIHIQWKDVIVNYFQYIECEIDKHFLHNLYELDELKFRNRQSVLSLLIGSAFILSMVWATFMWFNLFSPIAGLYIFIQLFLPMWKDYTRYRTYTRVWVGGEDA
jgi:hypothetical protein